MTCDQASNYVLAAGGDNSGWSTIFTMGFPGLTQEGHIPVGMTYPQTRTVEVLAIRPEVLRHEYGHAWDIDHGLPNHRD